MDPLQEIHELREQIQQLEGLRAAPELLPMALQAVEWAKALFR